MSYESRAYDKTNTDGFGPDPVVVLVVTGTHDVSRLINLFAAGQPVIEQIAVGERIRKQVRQHNGGRMALELLRQHGGPDFTQPACEASETQMDILRLAAQGLAVKEIARKLGKGTSAVGMQLHRLYKAIGATGLTHAVSIAHERGWLGGAS